MTHGSSQSSKRAGVLAAFAGIAISLIAVAGLSGIPDPADVVTLNDGTRLDGRIAGCTPYELLLVSRDGAELVIDRDEVTAIHAPLSKVGIPKRRVSARAMLRHGIAWLLNREARARFLDELQDPKSWLARTFASPQASPSAARASARSLGRGGRREALRVLVPLLAHADGAVIEAAQDAIARVVQRHRGLRVWALLSSLASGQKVAPEVRARVAQCVAMVDDPEGQRYLDALLGTDRALDPTLLPALAQTLAKEGVHFDASDLSARVEPMLRSDDATLRRESALLLGRLQSAQAIGGLIELIDDENEGVRGNACWALGQTTGLRLPADVARWTDWWNDQEEWRERCGEKTLEELRSGSEAAVASAAVAVSQRPILRDQASEALGELLFDERPGIRAVAAYSLARLRCVRAAPQIRGLLEDDDERVREAAKESLKSLLGEEAAAAAAPAHDGDGEAR